ncbi:MAG: universal stress protein [Chitinophagales bacterium]
MKTVVVPIDFSTTSLNAADYAVKMLTGSYDTNLVLYHMYEKKSDEEVVLDQLSNLKNSITKNSPLRIETIAVHGDDLITEIERVVHHRQADLVVMGITAKTGLEQVFAGSNTLKLVDKNAVPVLIIPSEADFDQIKNVALASDFKDVLLSTPSVPIKSLLQLFHPALHIVNVDREHYISITAEYQKEKTVMDQLFADYDPEFYFIGMNDFFEAIWQFIQDKKIDILITIPRHHSLISGILKEVHTKKLAYHTHIPILAVHE